MSKKFVLLFLAALIPVLATDTVYLRTNGSGASCKITGATNSTPIVITFTAGCSFAIGDPVIIYHVRGNYAANGVRKVKNDGNFSSTTFAITDIGGTDIAGSGTYVQTNPLQVGVQPVMQPYVAPATLYSLNTHPRGVFTSAILA